MWLRIQQFVIIFLSLTALSSCEESADEVAPENELSMEERWMSEICSSKYNGRKAGTIGCEQVASFIIGQLDSMGYEVCEQPFRLKDSLDLKNIYVHIRGKSDSLLVLGAHYDGAVQGENYSAADDNGSGVVTLLSICDFFSKQTNSDNLHYSVLFAFWAAEEVTIKAAFNGSRFFVRHYEDKEKVRYYCNLDCFARKGQDLFFYYSPLSSKVADHINNCLQSYYTSGFKILVKESDKNNSDFVIFHEAGIPFFGWNDIITFGFVHSQNDNIEHISFEKIRAVCELTSRLIQLL